MSFEKKIKDPFYAILKNKFVVFILAISILVNVMTFVQEYVSPGSAEHWQVGTLLLIFSAVIYLWDRKEPDEIKEYTFLITFTNGMVAMLLDVLCWVIANV